MISRLKNLLFLALVMLSINETAFAASVIDTIKTEIAGWITALSGLGMLVAGGTWVLGDIFHVSWIEHYARKNKEGLIKLAVFLGVISAISAYIQSAMTKMANPFGG
ncbi:MAG: hypothetical protein NTU84_10475 [Verrucomicrobia bacterium]|nr:hypothetical protein [Verrucomicrobiota bacterium]